MFASGTVRADPEQGLVGYWPFSGDARDQSGNGNNASVAGAVLTADRFGRATNAFYFDGINDYIDIPYSPAIEPDVFSVSVWAKTKGTGRQVFISSDPSNSGCSHGWQIGLNFWNYPNATFGVDVSRNCGDGSEVSVARDLSDDLWHHFVCMYGLRQRLYVNGVLVADGSPKGYYKTQASLRRRCDRDSSGRHGFHRANCDRIAGWPGRFGFPDNLGPTVLDRSDSELVAPDGVDDADEPHWQRFRVPIRRSGDRQSQAAVLSGQSAVRPSVTWGPADRARTVARRDDSPSCGWQKLCLGRVHSKGARSPVLSRERSPDL